MVRVTTSKARENFTKMLQRASRGERIVLLNHKKEVAALVPIADLALLEDIEDRVDARAGRLAMQEAERAGTIPWEKVKAELEL
jgi:prevent-host-death family protein